MNRFEFDDFDVPTPAAPPTTGRPAGTSLCTGCKHAHIYRRREQPDVSIYCHQLGRYVPPDIVECNEFGAVGALSLYEMQRLAVPIDPRPGIHDGSYR